MVEIKPFDESTRPEVEQLTDVSFGPATHALLDKILSNPLRQNHSDVGSLATDGERTLSFRSAVVRQIVFERKIYPAMISAMLCMRKDTDPTILLDVLKASSKMRNGGWLYFSNTACKATMRLSKLIGFKGKGPSSCAMQRLQPIHWLRFAWYIFLHVVFKRPALCGKPMLPADSRFVCSFGEDRVRVCVPSVAEGFDAFWRSYCETCEGLVSSRTVEELAWAFRGNRWSVLGYYRDEELYGYIALKSCDALGNRWMIADWIALQNDTVILDHLLEAARKFLRKETRAILFQTTGFPTFVQTILAKYFHFSRRLLSNEFIYRIDDKELEQKVEPIIDTSKSWFFGAYDGDACLC